MLNKVTVLLSLLLFAGIAGAWNPLEPPDTSSPRATMQSFLNLTEEVARRARIYHDSPTRENQQAMFILRHKAALLFDLSQVPPAAQGKVTSETFLMLWDILGRVDLPDLEQIPDAAALKTQDQEDEQKQHWRIPGTEIHITRIEEGPHSNEFLFSQDTVERMRSFYEQVRGLPYLRPMSLDHPYEYFQHLSGWLIPPTWIASLPDWAKTLVLEQMFWKWFAVLFLFGLAAGAVLGVYRWASRGFWHGILPAYLRRASVPLLMIALAPALMFFISYQINVTGVAVNVLTYLIYIGLGLAIIWLIWLTSGWFAELIINSPKISPESLLAQLIRLAARSIAIAAILAMTFKVAYEIGIPVYGLVTGAGLGGLAVALAVRSTLEDIIGTLNLYADRPVKLGDFCRYGEDPSSGWLRIGTIEEIGLRSTRIRGIDRTVTTIPNSDFSKMHIVNLTVRDRMAFRPALALRHETSADQLRLVLARLRELLLAHPRVTDDPARVRFAGFGEYALNVDIFAYVDTSDWNEFLAIQEDINLRILDIVEEVGTGFAMPSRLYLARDHGIDDERQQAAAQQIREWVANQSLPFPDFAEDHRKRIAETLRYPPEGSPAADAGRYTHNK